MSLTRAFHPEPLTATPLTSVELGFGIVPGTASISASRREIPSHWEELVLIPVFTFMAETTSGYRKTPLEGSVRVFL